MYGFSSVERFFENFWVENNKIFIDYVEYDVR